MGGKLGGGVGPESAVGVDGGSLFDRGGIVGLVLGEELVPGSADRSLLSSSTGEAVESSFAGRPQGCHHACSALLWMHHARLLQCRLHIWRYNA